MAIQQLARRHKINMGRDPLKTVQSRTHDNLHLRNDESLGIYLWLPRVKYENGPWTCSLCSLQMPWKPGVG